MTHTNSYFMRISRRHGFSLSVCRNRID